MVCKLQRERKQMLFKKPVIKKKNQTKPNKILASIQTRAVWEVDLQFGGTSLTEEVEGTLVVETSTKKQ